MAHHQTHDALIRTALDCHRECLTCVDHCLTLGGRHAEAGHVRAMLDCAAICAAIAGFLARGSRHGKHLAGECAEICDACASSCGEHPDADAHMKQCAETCRRCAEACRALAA